MLFQAVLKNPLADPGIIGISSGASFAAVLITAFAPTLFFFTPLFAFLGGVIAFVLVYSLSWKGGLSPLRIILVGVAVDAMFTGLSSALNSMNGGNMSGVAAIVNGNITMKTWDDVKTLVPYVIVGLVLALIMTKMCNLLALEDKTATWEVQGESPTAYAKMLDKKLGDIDWSRSAKSIECLIRGLNPWPSAYTDWNGKVMKIWEAGVLDENTDAKPGTIVKVEKDGFFVQTGDGLLKVLALQIPGKKRMEADAFLRGYQIETGCELSSQMIKNC